MNLHLVARIKNKGHPVYQDEPAKPESAWRSGNFLDYQLQDPGSIPGRDKFIAMLVGVRRPIISPSLKTPKPSEAL